MKPRLLLTFANPAVDDPGHLRGLPAERAAIHAALEDAMTYGLCAVDVEPETTRDGLIDRLQDADAMAHVVVFHYAGHASGSALALDGVDGSAAAYAAGVAALLGRLPRLELVFLNGCSTRAQVEALLAAGVPTVIATAVDIIDAVATDFATHFYRRLGAGDSVKTAFRAAEAAVRTAHADPTERRNLGRSFLPKPTGGSADLPWILHVATEDDARWSLPQAADDPLFILPRPQWPTPERPYPGAAPYAAADGAVFCGRRHEIRAMYDALCSGSGRLVVLHGPPKSGKTSLLAAGLLPRLQVEHDAALVSLNGWQQTPEILLVDDADFLPDHAIEALAARSHAVALAVTQLERVLALVPDALPIALTHLDAAAIEQVVDDPLTTLGVPPDPRLVMRLVDDLRGGASTPIVAAVLADLWAHRPGETLTIEAYEQVRSAGRLDAFVDAQLVMLGGANPEWIVSGFALEVLAHHLTLLGTAREHAVADLRARYPHRSDLPHLLDAAVQTALLVQTETGTALGHAQLAPFIANHFGASRAPGQQARRIIEERLPAWASGAEGPVLDAVDLEAVQGGRAAMAGLDADAERLIAQSEAAVTAAAKRKRVTRLSFVAAAVAVVALAFSWQQQRVQTAREAAEKARAVARAEVKQQAAEVKQREAEVKRREAEAQRERAAAEARLAEEKKTSALEKARLEAEKAAELEDVAAMTQTLVEAYPHLDDPDSGQQADGLLQLAGAVSEYPKLAPHAARLAVRAWRPLMNAPDEAAQRLARPGVFRDGGAITLIDRAGRQHLIDAQPDFWFSLPGGRFLALHDPVQERVLLYDARSGAQRGDFKAGGVVEHIVTMRAAKRSVIIVTNPQASEPVWQLVVIDTRTGKGESVEAADLPWSGTCATNVPVMRGPGRVARVSLTIGRDGKMVPARTTQAQRVRFEDCIQRRIPQRPIAAHAIAPLAPEYTRWRAREATAAERARAVSGIKASLPARLKADRRGRVRGGKCEQGCGFLDGGRAFGVDRGKVFVERNVCDRDGGSEWLPRWCHTDGRSGYAFASPDALRALNLQDRPPPRRRGDHVLFQGMLLRLDTLEALKLNYTGVAYDFAVSPDRERIILLTRDAVLRLALTGDTYEVVWLQPVTDDRPLATVFVGVASWAIQYESGVVLRTVGHERLLWRRRWPARRGGLATNGEVLLVRGDARLMLRSVADGISLSPEEVIGLGDDPQLEVKPDGRVVVVDGNRVWTRQAIPANADITPLSSDGLPSPDTLPTLRGQRRCPQDRTVVDGECWPTQAARQMGRIQ